MTHMCPETCSESASWVAQLPWYETLPALLFPVPRFLVCKPPFTPAPSIKRPEECESSNTHILFFLKKVSYSKKDKGVPLILSVFMPFNSHLKKTYR